MVAPESPQKSEDVNNAGQEKSGLTIQSKMNLGQQKLEGLMSGQEVKATVPMSGPQEIDQNKTPSGSLNDTGVHTTSVEHTHHSTDEDKGGARSIEKKDETSCMDKGKDTLQCKDPEHTPAESGQEKSLLTIQSKINLGQQKLEGLMSGQDVKATVPMSGPQEIDQNKTPSGSLNGTGVHTASVEQAHHSTDDDKGGARSIEKKDETSCMDKGEDTLQRKDPEHNPAESGQRKSILTNESKMNLGQQKLEGLMSGQDVKATVPMSGPQEIDQNKTPSGSLNDTGVHTTSVEQAHHSTDDDKGGARSIEKKDETSCMDKGEDTLQRKDPEHNPAESGQEKSLLTIQSKINLGQQKLEGLMSGQDVKATVPMSGPQEIDQNKTPSGSLNGTGVHTTSVEQAHHSTDEDKGGARSKEKKDDTSCMDKAEDTLQCKDPEHNPDGVEKSLVEKQIHLRKEIRKMCPCKECVEISKNRKEGKEEDKNDEASTKLLCKDRTSLNSNMERNTCDSVRSMQAKLCKECAENYMNRKDAIQGQEEKEENKNDEVSTKLLCKDRTSLNSNMERNTCDSVRSMQARLCKECAENYMNRKDAIQGQEEKEEDKNDEVSTKLMCKDRTSLNSNMERNMVDSERSRHASSSDERSNGYEDAQVTLQYPDSKKPSESITRLSNAGLYEQSDKQTGKGKTKDQDKEENCQEVNPSVFVQDQLIKKSLVPKKVQMEQFELEMDKGEQEAEPLLRLQRVRSSDEESAQTLPVSCTFKRVCVKVVGSFFAAIIVFPALLYFAYAFLPFDAPLMPQISTRLVYTLRCGVFASLPIVLGVIVHGISRLCSSSFDPFNPKVREVTIHRRFVKQSTFLFVLYFFNLAALSTYLPQDYLKLIPLLTCLFALSQLVYWLSFAIGRSFRGFGYGLTFLPLLAMLACNLYYVFIVEPEKMVYIGMEDDMESKPRSTG
ncbi:transmembrane protein 79 [Discoglossus pictus]